MTWEAWAALALVVGILYALARNLAGPDVVLLGAVAVVMTLGWVSDRFPDASDVAGILGNEGLLTVGILFVVAAGLTETGALRLVTERLLGRLSSTRSAQLRLMVPVATISALNIATTGVLLSGSGAGDRTSRPRSCSSRSVTPPCWAGYARSSGRARTCWCRDS